MKKYFIAFMVALCMIFTISAQGASIINPSEVFNLEKLDFFYDVKLYTYTMEELEELIAEQLAVRAKAHELAEAARALGWPEDSIPIIMAKTEHYNAGLALRVYQARYETLKWNKQKKEYPIATEIWVYMKSLGWNDYVCAGIMGNLMSETGGQTLNIKPLAKGKGYYGICQWSKVYNPDVWDTSLEDQLEYLQNSIKREINTYGYAYSKGFNYDSFLKLTDEQEVAKVFAKCYERCNSSSYAQRQKNATIAYNYFVGN